MKFHSIIILLVTIFVTSSCKPNLKKKCERFINNCDHTQFTDYSGYGMFYRGIDCNGDRLFYISKTLNTDSFINSGNAIISLDSANNVTGLDTSELKFHLNKDTLINVIKLFNDLKIYGLGIDYTKNLYFSILSFEKTDLIRIENNEIPDDKDWIVFKPNWYIRK